MSFDTHYNLPMPSRPTDQALARAARRGDSTALAVLVDRHYPALLSSCRRMLGDADLARDAAQEAVLRAMLGVARLRDDERFGAWLIGIGLNVCRSLLGARRTQRRSAPVPGEEWCLAQRSAVELEPVEKIAADDVAARVHAAIAALPAGQRHAVALFYLGGLTHAEAAEEIGVRPGAVKTRLHNARKSLRASLLDTYKEYIDMSEPTAELIPMHIAELRRTAATEPGTERHILFLEDEADRRLPIWIGQAEATALALILEDTELPRPGVYQFAAALLAGAGGRLREVHVTELTSSIFYARAILSDGTSIDARPSDALTLALVTGVPILVSAGVLEQAAKREADIGDLLQEANDAPDDARAIVEEFESQRAAMTAEIAAREHPTP